jgi:hypothetical protein
MPNVPIEFMRGVVGLLCLFFGYMGGRAAAAVAKRLQPASRLFTWILRMVVASALLVFRTPIDTLVIGVWTTEMALFGLGYWLVTNQKPPEDLTHEIFPE